tara:strand:- start:335 stop:580 length:246 start_codon:yes stop_codon:yes gene_type:complete
MQTINDLFDAFGGIQQVADAAGVEYSSAACWRANSRMRIPPGRWPSLVGAAREQGIGLTYDDLERIERNAKAERDKQSEAA